MPEIYNGNLNGFFNTSQVQYVIPAYQRTISWPLDRWQDLLGDILRISDNPKKTHFIQMFQFQNSEDGSSIIVGDGQQRLVHTSLILIALAYSLKEISLMEGIFETKSQYDLASIYNRILSETDSRQASMLSFYDYDGRKKPKIVVSPKNRRSYEALVFWNYDSLPKKEKEKCIVQEAFEFYKLKITSFIMSSLDNSNIDGNNIVNFVSKVLNKSNTLLNAMEFRLVFASAHFKTMDEMQISYENTNRLNVPLTESELIKNNIFGKFSSPVEQEELVHKYWNFFDEEYWINKKSKPNKNSDGIEFDNVIVDRLDNLFYYHMISVIGDPKAFSREETNATFKAFKNFYEKSSSEALMRAKMFLSLEEKEEFNDQSFISTYYENVLKNIYEHAKLYKKLDLEKDIVNDEFDKKAQEFYNRLKSESNPGLILSLIFSFKKSGLKDYEYFKDVLVALQIHILSFVMNENTDEIDYGKLFLYIKNNVSLEEFKKELNIKQ